jgi:O-antigen/teichoic acid export membrane protein
VAINRQGRALVAVTLAAALAALGNHLALRSGYGLVGVAAATAIGYLAYFTLVLKISLWIELDRAERRRYLAMLALALAPTLGLAIVWEVLWPAAESTWSTAAAKAAVVALGWGFAVSVGWRRGRWREAWQGKP